MSENVRSAMASENVRFMIAAVIAIVLIAVYQFTSPDSPPSYTELSDPAVEAPAATMGVPAR